MTFIPKISVGVDTGRNKFHVPSITHATSEIGYVLPTYSRSCVPNTHLKVNTRTGVRLSPLFVPTMGEMEVRHYHTFVQYDKLWTPFDAFIARKPFTFSNGISQMPTRCPYFSVGNILRSLMTDYDPLITQAMVGTNFRGSLTCTIWDGDHQLTANELNGSYLGVDVKTKLMDNYFCEVGGGHLYHFYQSGMSYMCGVPSFIQSSDGTNFIPTRNSSAQLLLNDASTLDLNLLSFPTPDACDFQSTCYLTSTGTPSVERYLTICYNFNGPWKRLRSIFLGLGYCFNPFDDINVTPFKLLAFYRAYWSLFGVNRGTNFADTPCNKLTQLLSAGNGGSIVLLNWANELNNTGVNRAWQDFILDLANCTYTTPVDYFSSSVTNTQNGIADSGGDVIFTSELTGSPNAAAARSTTNASAYQTTSTALSMKIAQRLLRFVNKYTVVGSKVSEILRSRFGSVNVDDESSENVHRIGAVSTPIEINAIYSQSETTDMPLGSYAGLGVGGSQGRSFDFETDNFGVFITLTAVVPKMGYFQGMLRENSDGVNDSFDFYNPEWDAIGWQSVRYNELVSDRQFYNGYGTLSPGSPYGTSLGIFGYQPTYTHLKVGFNRCIGDISLPHMQDSMLPYTLDRFFSQRDKTLPLNVPQSFRAGTQGNTNRIFSVTTPTDDHVIMQIVFDVEMDAPMRSIATSYDTSDETSTHSIEVSHE